MSANLSLGEIEAFFHQQIPVTQAMGVRVVAYDSAHFVIEAPLFLNHNHLGTAFGGSLSALATLAGYGLIWLELGDPTCHVVIRKSSISYRRPVRHQLRAVCRRPDPAALATFREEFAQRGQQRLRLAVTIEDAGQTAVEFDGLFVAMKKTEVDFWDAAQGFIP